MSTALAFFDLGVDRRFKQLTIREDVIVLIHIMTSGKRCVKYCRSIKSLVFKVETQLFDVVTITTLAKFLPMCSALRNLTVEVSSGGSKYADAAIRRHGLVRLPETMVQVIAKRQSPTTPPTPWRLPCLERLSLGYGLGMLSLMNYRFVSALWVTRPLTFLELDPLFSALSDRGAVHHLDTLGLTLDINVSPQSCLLALSRVENNIQVLSITQREANLPVGGIRWVTTNLIPTYILFIQNVLNALRDPDVFFPRLQTLLVNRYNRGAPVIPKSRFRKGAVGGSVGWVRAALMSCEERNSKLRSALFGSQYWEKGWEDCWWPYPTIDTLLWWEDVFGQSPWYSTRRIDSKKVARVMVNAWCQ